MAVIVAVVVGLAAYIALGSVSSDWEANAVIEVVDQNTTAVLLELEKPFPERSASAVAAALKRFGEDDGIKGLSALPVDQSAQVLVKLEGSTRSIAATLETEIDRFIDDQRATVGTQIDAAVAAAETRVADLNKELAAIDALAATNPNDDVVRLRRLEAQHDLSDARKRIADFGAIRSDLQAGLQRTKGTHVVRPGAGSVSRILAPAVLALLVGVGAALGIARLDSRLRTGRQISSVSGGLPLLGVVASSRSGDDDALAALVLAIRHLESTVKRPLVVAPLSSRQPADVLSPALTSDLTRITEPISESSEAISAAAQGHAVVLLADSRVDRPRHLKQAIQLLAAVGVTAEGVVLVVESSSDRLHALIDSDNG
jgi:hypothetical protein